MHARASSRWPGSILLTLALAMGILVLSWPDRPGAGRLGAEASAATLAQARDMPLVMLGLPAVVLHRLWQKARE